jgi:hypothetical protein
MLQINKITMNQNKLIPDPNLYVNHSPTEMFVDVYYDSSTFELKSKNIFFIKRRHTMNGEIIYLLINNKEIITSSVYSKILEKIKPVITIDNLKKIATIQVDRFVIDNEWLDVCFWQHRSDYSSRFYYLQVKPFDERPLDSQVPSKILKYFECEYSLTKDEKLIAANGIIYEDFPFIDPYQNED